MKYATAANNNFNDTIMRLPLVVSSGYEERKRDRDREREREREREEAGTWHARAQNTDTINTY